MAKSAAETRQEFLEDAKFLEKAAQFPQGTALRAFNNNFLEAVAAFGTAELSAANAARRDVLEIQPERSRLANDEVRKHNEKGLRILSNARNSLHQFNQELSGFPQRTNFEPWLQNFRDEFREALADTDLKPHDVKKIDKLAEECIATIRSEGAQGVYSILTKHVDDLERHRKSPNRGTEDNIPWWKIAALVVMIGVGTWAIIKCGLWGDCSEAEAAGYGTAIAVASVVLRYC